LNPRTATAFGPQFGSLSRSSFPPLLDLLEAIRSYLVKQGLNSSSKALVKEASLNKEDSNTSDVLLNKWNAAAQPVV
jgi:hypothetical protein